MPGTDTTPDAVNEPEVADSGTFVHGVANMGATSGPKIWLVARDESIAELESELDINQNAVSVVPTVDDIGAARSVYVVLSKCPLTGTRAIVDVLGGKKKFRERPPLPS